MGHGEFARHLLARRVGVNTNALVCTDHLRALNDIQPKAAQPKHHHIRTQFTLAVKSTAQCPW